MYWMNKQVGLLKFLNPPSPLIFLSLLILLKLLLLQGGLPGGEVQESGGRGVRPPVQHGGVPQVGGMALGQ